MPDFTYREEGAFVRLYPETPEAVREWNEEIGPKTGGAILVVHFPDVLSQLKAAGYVVHKARDIKMSDADLLEALG